MASVAGVELGPGLAAFLILVFSLAAKLFMSFGVRASEPKGGYEALDKARIENISKAQLNVAEYEGLMIAVFLYFYLAAKPSVLLTIVSVAVPLCQFLYFWGRVATGAPVPFAIIGALPRYICMGIMIYIMYTTLSATVEGYGPGVAAWVVFFLSYIAKLFMSFGIRAANNGELGEAEKAKNASAAQLNVKEYEGIFVAVFLFLHLQKAEGILVTVVSYWVPAAQAVYFWGRVITGTVMPAAVIGALSRYICMVITTYLLYQSVTGEEGKVVYGPGLAAVVVFALCLSAKLFMSFGIRATNTEGEKKENASKAQLNAAEYDDVFISIFLFLCLSNTSSLPVTICSYWVPAAQCIYFWGRIATGSIMPCAPIGALSRYVCMGILSYVMFGAVVLGA